MRLESRGKARQAWVLGLTSLASCMVALDALVVMTALSSIRRDLGASLEELEWTVNAYTLSFAVLLVTAAALGDRFGRRRMFVSGLFLFVVASAACALAHSIGWLIAARAIQGSGAALVLPLALTQLSLAFPSEQRGRALGIFSGMTGLASISGPVLGGAISQGLAWQWIFWLNVPIGLLVIICVLHHMQESFGPRPALDICGLLSVSAAALGLVWGLARGNSAGWGSLEVITTLIAGLLFAGTFIAWERRAYMPMLPMHFFRSRAFSAGNTTNFLVQASIIGAVFFIAQFLQTAQGYGPLDTGLRLLPWTSPLFVIAPLAGVLINRLGERPLIVGGLLLQSAGMAWISLIATPSLPYLALVAPLLISGCGVSMAFPATQNVVISSVAVEDIGKASGTFSMIRQLGGAFGVAILAAVFTSVGSFSSTQAISHGVAAALSVSAALSLLGALIALLLSNKREKESEAEKEPETRKHPTSQQLWHPEKFLFTKNCIYGIILSIIALSENARQRPSRMANREDAP